MNQDLLGPPGGRQHTSSDTNTQYQTLFLRKVPALQLNADSPTENQELHMQ